MGSGSSFLQSAALKRCVALSALVLVYLDIASTQWRAPRRAFDPWQTGDWLINYQGGFTRRGLIGELLFGLRGHGVSLIGLATSAQLVTLTVLFVALGIILLRIELEWTWMMAVFSPAWLLFGALYQPAALRKEIIAFMVIALMVALTKSGRSTLAVWGAAPASALVVLAHEGLVVVVPTLLVVVWHGVRPSLDDARRVVATASILVIAVAGVALAARFDGAGSVDGICASWQTESLDCSGGALAALDNTVAESSDLVERRLRDAFRFTAYAALAYLPIWLTGLPSTRPVATAMVIAATVPLYVVAVDYGRWIMLAAGQLTLLALLEEPRLREEGRIRLVPAGWALAFVSLWAMGHSTVTKVPSIVVRLLTHVQSWTS